jgi:hypothetical protein
MMTCGRREKKKGCGNLMALGEGTPLCLESESKVVTTLRITSLSQGGQMHSTEP